MSAPNAKTFDQSERMLWYFSFFIIQFYKTTSFQLGHIFWKPRNCKTSKCIVKPKNSLQNIPNSRLFFQRFQAHLCISSSSRTGTGADEHCEMLLKALEKASKWALSCNYFIKLEITSVVFREQMQQRTDKCSKNQCE